MLKGTSPARSLDRLLIGRAEGVDRFNADVETVLAEARRRSNSDQICVPLSGVDFQGRHRRPVDANGGPPPDRSAIDRALGAHRALVLGTADHAAQPSATPDIFRGARPGPRLLCVVAHGGAALQREKFCVRQAPLPTPVS